MKDRLAEELLVKVLQWTREEIAQERPLVQALAAYKYDEYLQFSAGTRFIESMALWLSQFNTAAERRTAYEFIKNQLVFVSEPELRHLVEIAYPDHIRPSLIERSAGIGNDRYRPNAVASRADFRVHQRQCLFLGLSDGARIDSFRRANPVLNHEQIWQTYELSEPRVDKLLKKLVEHLEQILGRTPDAPDHKFRTLVLLDDFSASGTSYYAHPVGAPTGGKITALFDDLFAGKPVSKVVDLERLEVIVLLYMATEQAIAHLNEASAATWGKKHIKCSIKVVQPLPEHLRLRRGDGTPLAALIEHDKYYDHSVHDEHFDKGGTKDARYGYAGCGLPVVLHHNTPNNSIALLMSYEGKDFRGLFPRIQRHREMS